MNQALQSLHGGSLEKNAYNPLKFKVFLSNKVKTYKTRIMPLSFMRDRMNEDTDGLLIKAYTILLDKFYCRSFEDIKK